MSGGSYDYAYQGVNDMAHNLERMSSEPLRRAFAEHLLQVATAMHAIEWVDSADYSKGAEVEHIRAVLKPGAEIEAAITMAIEAQTKLHDAIESAKQLQASVADE